MLIKGLSTKFKINYHHKLKGDLFEDLDNVTEFPQDNLSNYHIDQTNLDAKLVNTWIGQQGYKYLTRGNSNGCCFDNYWGFLNDMIRHYGIDMLDQEWYLPSVDYTKLSDFKEISTKFQEKISEYDKIILISNGDVHSRQSMNFNFEPIIIELSKKHPNYLFLVTKNLQYESKNILYTTDLTNREQDLLYISYFSTKCDVIIGRSSGPYVYSLVKENIMDEKKTIISFNNKECEGYFYRGLKSKFVWSNNYDLNNIKTIIENNI
jgi:hypothetical protein